MTEKLKHPVYVTQPFLPPLSEVTEYLEKIWQSRQVTNQGPFHKQFEEELATSHSLWWNNIKPVFVDIKPQALANCSKIMFLV
jgi:dTDP-4-amino-4,6-dideoxygalactose transaminase